MMHRFNALVCLPLVLGGMAPVHSQDSNIIAMDSAPTRVTAYRGRAWIERAVSANLQPGIHTLVFNDLPARWQPETIQASVSGDANVLAIDTSTRQVSSGTGDLKNLQDEVESARSDLQSARDQLTVLEASIGFHETMMKKASAAAGEYLGTDGFDITSVKSQSEYFSSSLAELLAQIQQVNVLIGQKERQFEIAQSRLDQAGDSTRTQREAIVELMVNSEGEVGMTLGYLVSDANWSPRYDVRGDLNSGKLAMEYGAQIHQQTGEDWNDVELVLSTARPSRASNPPSMSPVFVDIYAPPPPAAGRRRGAGKMEADSMAYGGMIASAAVDARVQGGGSSVTFTLPRRTTVETNSEAAQRTRITEFDTDVDFVHVAMPVLTDEIYLRGRFQNTSDYQLLPGEAGIFMGGDYVGMAQIGSSAPGSELEMYFGVDPAMSAIRTMLTKNTGETGVFGGWLKTSYDFVLKIENGTDREARIELWDRRPISRSDEIQVAVENLSMPLSTNQNYLQDAFPQGLMRWDLEVAAGSVGKKSFVVSYDLDVERKEGVRMTPLPD